MKLSAFLELADEGKKAAVLHHGVLLDKRVSRGQFIFLFDLEGYYVEVYCDIAGKAIVEYRIFETTSPLMPYLEKISLDGLLPGD
ncbi:MAG TPA: hypothetical protein VFR58_02555 [Flavisolibacter sp.]|nr:hypothetical protein [Flavisolibacter sp.]